MLRADHERVLEAMAENGFALEHAAPELRADRVVVLAAVAMPAPPGSRGFELQGDREFEPAAVAQRGPALRYAAPVLRADRELVLAAVAETGLALR